MVCYGMIWYGDGNAMVWASWSLEGWQKRCGGGWLAASLSYPLTFTFFTFPFLLFFFICDFFQPVIGLPIGNVRVEELVMTCSISNFLKTLPTSSLTTNYSVTRCLASSFNLSTFNLSFPARFSPLSKSGRSPTDACPLQLPASPPLPQASLSDNWQPPPWFSGHCLDSQSLF